MYWAVLSHLTISNAPSDILVLESAVNSISHHTYARQPTMQRTISAWQWRNLKSKQFESFLICLQHSYSIPISNKTSAPPQYCLNYMTLVFHNMSSTLTAQPAHLKGNIGLGLTPELKICDVVEPTSQEVSREAGLGQLISRISRRTFLSFVMGL